VAPEVEPVDPVPLPRSLLTAFNNERTSLTTAGLAVVIVDGVLIVDEVLLFVVGLEVVVVVVVVLCVVGFVAVVVVVIPYIPSSVKICPASV
jgi:hypothetical protein